MKKISILITFLALIVLVGISSVYLYKKGVVKNDVAADKSNAGIDGQNAIENSGEQKTYVSSKYGISFNYPKAWNVGLGNDYQYGFIQLANYDMYNAEGHNFKAGQNKIEGSVVSNDAIDDFFAIEEGLKEEKTSSNVTLANSFVVKRIRSSVTNEGMPLSESLSYVIPMPKMKDSNLVFTIAGDTSNFRVLDEIVKTIKFTN